MFTYQTARLCPELENRKRRSVIHIKRRIQQIFQFIVQLLPFVSGQLPALNLSALDFTNIRYQTVDQLDITHFKREQCYRIPEVHSDILGHGKHESRLTHGGTGGNNNKVRILPAGSHLVQFRKTTLKATQTVGSCRSLLNQFVGLVNDRINLRVILLHILLRDLKQLAFRFLHQVVHIQRFIKSLALNITCKRNQFACQ